MVGLVGYIKSAITFDPQVKVRSDRTQGVRLGFRSSKTNFATNDCQKITGVYTSSSIEFETAFRKNEDADDSWLNESESVIT